MIWQSTEPAVLNRVLIVPVNVALRVVVFRLVEGINVGKIGLSIVRAVVSHNIEHHPDVTSVTCRDHLMEVFRATEFSADLLPVECAITMVVIWSLILRDWRNPNGIESHSLNVVEVVGDAFKSSATEDVKR